MKVADPVLASHPASPTLARRLAVSIYDGLLLFALLLVASFPFAGLKQLALAGIPHAAFQFYLLLVTATYFIWFWTHGGQTLPMKTWHIRLVTANGTPVGLPRALARFALALLTYGSAVTGTILLFFPHQVSELLVVWTFVPLLASLWWSQFDKEAQFLHDRLVGTRLILLY